MDKEIFINNIKQQFIDADDIQLAMDTDFRQLDSYDSLTGMTIMVMIKDEYNYNISENDYRAQKTIQNLYDFILLNKE